MKILRLPSHAHLILEDTLVRLKPAEQMASGDVSVQLGLQSGSMSIHLSADSTPVRGLHLRWSEAPPAQARLLRDAWGRQDGQQGWKGIDPREPMPWSFLLENQGTCEGIGVKTNPGSFCSWHLDAEGLSLYIDTRNGGSGVELCGRTLEVCPFQANLHLPQHRACAGHW